jgi:hypothetical protein
MGQQLTDTLHSGTGWLIQRIQKKLGKIDSKDFSDDYLYCDPDYLVEAYEQC